MQSKFKKLLLALVVTVSFDLILDRIDYYDFNEEDYFPLEGLKNLGNMIILSDAENAVKDFSLIPDENDMAMSATISAVVTNFQGQVTAIRHGLG